METLNNVAQAASKAVWGTPESKEEPISGKQGNTSQGEPYDAGNQGKPRSTTGVAGSDNVKPTDFSEASGDNYTTSSDKYTGTTAGTSIPPLEDNYDPAGGENKTTGTGATNFSSTPYTGNNDTADTTSSARYTENTESAEIAPLEDNYDPAGGENKTGNTETSAPEPDVSTSARDTTSSSAGPHKELGSSTKPGQDMSKAQQDVRDPSDPQTHPDEAAKKSNVDDSGEGLDVGDNPEKVDGPGPRPIAEVAKDFGGDAGNAKGDAAGKPGAEGGADEEDDDGPQKTSHGEGTGEQYVKSSGLKADGGDFDATKPGAGKEADRLLETKGVHHGEDKPSATADDAAPSNEKKKSFGEKIKETLHKPHFKH